MRIMPFMRRKKGLQFAGLGLDTSSGGGGSGSKNPDYVLGEEIDTGLLYNNKKLYRVTKSVDSPSFSMDFRFNAVDDIFLDETMSMITVGVGRIPLNYYQNANNNAHAFIRHYDDYSYVDGTCSTTFSGVQNWTITVYYTKKEV